MKSWKILRDCRLKGDGVHTAMLSIARLHNLALTGWLPPPMSSVDTELVALDVQHRDARIIAVIQRLYVYCTERDQSCAFGLKYGEAFFTHESGADPHIKMHPVLDGLPFRDALEVQSRAHT